MELGEGERAKLQLSHDGSGDINMQLLSQDGEFIASVDRRDRTMYTDWLNGPLEVYVLVTNPARAASQYMIEVFKEGIQLWLVVAVFELILSGALWRRSGAGGAVLGQRGQRRHPAARVLPTRALADAGRRSGGRRHVPGASGACARRRGRRRGGAKLQEPGHHRRAGHAGQHQPVEAGQETNILWEILIPTGTQRQETYLISLSIDI